MGRIAIAAALAVYATALAGVPILTPAKAGTIDTKPVKKHKRTTERALGSGDPRFVDQRWSSSSPSRSAGWVCPGPARSFDCATWPPPVKDDPDRNVKY